MGYYRIVVIMNPDLEYHPKTPYKWKVMNFCFCVGSGYAENQKEAYFRAEKYFFEHL